MKTNVTIIAALAALTSVSPCNAAVTALGVTQFADSDPNAGSGLINTGSLDLAINFGDVTDATINGVTFTGYDADWADGDFVTSGSGVTVTTDSVSGTGGAFRDIANFGLWGGATWAPLVIDLIDGSAGDTTLNLTLSGLDTGRTYTLQFISADGRNHGANNDYDVTYTLGGTNQTGTIGEFGTNNQGMIAAFEVSGQTSVGLTVFSDGGTFNIPTIMQGMAISSVAVPEPSSTALLSLAGLALILRRRK